MMGVGRGLCVMFSVTALPNWSSQVGGSILKLSFLQTSISQAEYSRWGKKKEEEEEKEEEKEEQKK